MAQTKRCEVIVKDTVPEAAAAGAYQTTDVLYTADGGVGASLVAGRAVCIAFNDVGLRTVVGTTEVVDGTEDCADTEAAGEYVVAAFLLPTGTGVYRVLDSASSVAAAEVGTVPSVRSSGRESGTLVRVVGRTVLPAVVISWYISEVGSLGMAVESSVEVAAASWTVKGYARRAGTCGAGSWPQRLLFRIGTLTVVVGLDAVVIAGVRLGVVVASVTMAGGDVCTEKGHTGWRLTSRWPAS